METLYPSAVWIPAHASNYRRAGRTGYSKIVIHCTDGRPDPRAVAQMWQTAGHGSSAHFVVGVGGQIIQAVSLADVAWHAHAANETSVGIEHCCRSPGELGPSDPGLPPTPEQLAASARLVRWLCSNGGFQPSRLTIVGHAECDPKTTHKDCPEGAGLNLGAYVGLVDSLVGASFA